MPDRVGYVGSDVYFHLTSKNADHCAVWAYDGLRGCFLTCIGRLPGILCTPATHLRCLHACGWQRVITIHQQRTRGLWPDRCVEWQEVGLRIPEHVTEIGITRQAARAD